MATKSEVKKRTAASQKKASGTKAGKPGASKKSAPQSGKKGKMIPTHEEISAKAHEIYLERMAKGEPGNPDSDWQQALERLQASK